MPKKQRFDLSHVERVRQLCIDGTPSLEALRLNMRISYPSLVSLMLEAGCKPIQLPSGIGFTISNNTAGYQAVLWALEEHGPMSRSEINERVEAYGRNGLQRALALMRDRKMIHVYRWDAGIKGYTPIYAIGPCEDAPMPGKMESKPRKQRIRVVRQVPPVTNTNQLPRGFFG